MVQKRQLAEEEYNVSSKHLKLELSCDLVPTLQFTKEDVPLHSDNDGGYYCKLINEADYGCLVGMVSDIAGCLSTSSSANSTKCEEDLKFEAPFHASNHYSYLLEHSPVKEVPIGPEYQADIPELRGYDQSELKFLGSCVIPMPEDPTVYDNAKRNKTECYCQISVSVRCAQQHISEARDNIKESVGLETFAELGFNNMGETVADKWSEEDEELFHEVVSSNPVSIGKNYWAHLAAEFPSRTYQEIVSYYFNVFVLRRRAEQNRFDPMNADSDDDEWQGSDRSDEDDGIHKSDYYESGNQIMTRYNDSYPMKLHDSCSFESLSQLTEKTDYDIDYQYDSCTSSDTAGEPCTSEVTIGCNRSWGNNEFIFEPLDSRVWDVGYIPNLITKTDFLPTGIMIEEVFGVESWDIDI
ncbi:uncharacterized protein [Rutidosis leptorrhynchoides]|uniref:uncharacterized protein n=1 Tax=Rutidosis leptorrhynchoides TaxID=125765 RepID=UPI003A9921FD